MTADNPRAGITVMIAAMFVFAAQDGISRHLAENYNVMMVVMIRYWFFMLFVLAISKIRTGSVVEAAKTQQPFVQLFRGLLLALEIMVTIYAFTLLGLVEAHAIFAVYPLIIAALSGVLLGEQVGWRRWAAIGVGFIGILIILQPGLKVFSAGSFVALGGALLFAVYNLLTRYAARKDNSTTSFFWTGFGGFLVMSAVGPFYWQPMTGPDSLWMGLLCLTGALGHFLLIKTYELTQASTVQPLAFLQLAFASMIGVFVFSEPLPYATALGTGLIVAAGLFTLWREQVAAKKLRVKKPQT